MRALLITLSTLFIPSVCFAGISGLLVGVFGPGGKGAPIMLLVALSLGTSILVWLLGLFGQGKAAKWIGIIAGCFALGMVLDAVLKLLDPTLSLFGY